MAVIKVVLNVPEAEEVEDWLEEAIYMFGRTLGEGSRTISVCINENRKEREDEEVSI